MSQIRVLPRAVAERIAAGEVIERPSSVVKELVENSLDAGATEVAVLLEAGGKSLIEILDNGQGIAPEDLPIAVKRHATSKLQTLDDLDRIRTLGFRGEALPSIAAVAELQIVSRSATAPPGASAYELDLSQQYLEADFGPSAPSTATGGSPGAAGVASAGPAPRAFTFGHFLGSPHGTRIQARGLFSQIPARLKFLKSQAAEVSQVREWLERIALTHPGVGFKLLSDGRTLLNLRPQSEQERVRAVLADGEDFPLISVTESEAGGLTAHSDGILALRLHWLHGLSVPHTRKLVQVVNRRAVRDKLLQQAVLSAFRQALLPGQFPGVAVFLEVAPDRIDVNVHPTKTEVRFLDSSRIFRALSKSVEELIARHGAMAFASGAGANPWGAPAGARPLAGETRGAPQAAWARPEATSLDVLDRPSHAGAPPAGVAWGGAGASAGQPSGWQSGWAAREPRTAQTTPSLFASLEPVLPSGPAASSSAGLPGAAPAAGAAGSLFARERYRGTLFQTYLLYDLGTELGLIDQHAAHERIRYEKLKKRALGEAGASASQQLLIPEAVGFVPELRPELEARIPWLEKLGFEVEIFGEDKALFRAVPEEWGSRELRVRLRGLIERTLEADRPSTTLVLDENLFERLASEACHSAIRAGDRLGDWEAASLVEQLFRCEHPWNCPHGRPTVARIPSARFEEWFQRRV
jgi:DNA mismatch repair protein MutL